MNVQAKCQWENELWTVSIDIREPTALLIYEIYLAIDSMICLYLVERLDAPAEHVPSMGQM